MDIDGAVPILPSELWTAVSQGQVDEARQFLAEGADVDEKGGQNESTPLYEAADKPQTKLVSPTRSQMNWHRVSIGLYHFPPHLPPTLNPRP
jgi:hypothetical protein